ncbi:Hypothetical protein R9X50_00518500 [Acrodontium crateriforme]|uniref:Pheromone alpha factor receptor n=1 Tax=Acrodontium crateriforme TaxID=150365 RepID=A0AAQ3M5L5_9PEZI|nr:Hypothetical protein R9X50_00518500 [Acrodontium crateriforme]
MDFPANSSFDPYSQSFNLYKPDGVTPFVANMGDLLALQAIIVYQGIIYGIQIGLCVLLLLVLLLMTKPDKRRSLVFVLNSLVLLFMVFRNTLPCAQLRDIFYNYYNWQLHWYPEGPSLKSAQGLSMATEIISLLVNITIHASLVLQVNIVCGTISREKRFLVFGLCSILALTTCSVRLALAVVNSKYLILGIRTTTIAEQSLVNRVGSASNILSVTSIALYSLIFNVKLAFAIHTRRTLNMKQFGPMQIIFVMGCQTMIIPLIFAALAYYLPWGSQINSFVPTIVAIFLPLSGMWASANTSNRRIVTENRNARAVPVSVSEPAASGDNSRKEKYLYGDTAVETFGSETDIEKGYSPTLVNMQMHPAKGVYVDRSYSVRSE